MEVSRRVFSWEWILSLAGGDEYNGEYLDGLKHGRGRLIFLTGTVCWLI